MKKIIVVTSIYPLSQAVKKFATFKDWLLIIVGDKKTPHKEYIQLQKENENVFYMTPEYQEQKWKNISDLIGWNSIQRRNIGFLEALNQGGDIIASIDDDNIPFDNWCNDIRIGKPTDVYYYETDSIVLDPIGVTNYNKLWHRGYPIQTLHNRNNKYKLTYKTVIPDIQAMFWNGDPDIDAVCRFEHKPMCFFDSKYFPIATNAFSPFNSQNTLFSREALKRYLVIPYIGRMDDIWAGYFLQSQGFNVIYTEANVFQDRNVQNLTSNLVKEFIGYEKTLELLKNIKNDKNIFFNYLPEKSIQVINEYYNKTKLMT